MSIETKTKHAKEPTVTADAYQRALSEIVRLQKRLKETEPAANACAGMEDPAKAIKEALDSLRGSERLRRQRGDTMAAASCAAALRALGG